MFARALLGGGSSGTMLEISARKGRFDRVQQSSCHSPKWMAFAHASLAEFIFLVPERR
jgi:hypothetical protein